MSRSFKKTPIIKDHNKGEKKNANHKVRRTKDVPNGGSYKKFYPQWDICDWSSGWSKRAYIRRWEHRHDAHRWSWIKDKSFHDVMRYWYKTYYWK